MCCWMGHGMICRSSPSKGLWYATGIRRPGTGWMQVIEIFACPEDGEEFFKTCDPLQANQFWESVLSCGEMMCAEPIPGGGTNSPKSRPPPRYVCRIDLLLLAKVWVSAHGEFSSRPGAVAAIAICLRVDDIASQSHQRPVLSFQIQMHRRDLESLLDPRIFVIVPVVAVIRLSARRTEQHSQPIRHFRPHTTVTHKALSLCPCVM